MLVLSIPKTLPDDFRKQPSVMSDFLSGRVAAIPVTATEITRLMRLADAGRAPDHQVLPGEASFTDQLAMCAIVDWPREDAEARKILSKQLIDQLLSDEAQAKLSSIQALRVTQGSSLYSGSSPMAALEQGYLSRAFSCPNAFDPAFRQQAAQILETALTD